MRTTGKMNPVLCCEAEAGQGGGTYNTTVSGWTASLLPKSIWSIIRLSAK